MSVSEVYFIDAKEGTFTVEKLETLLEKVGVGDLKGVTALKMHMGERNNKTFVKPYYVQKIVAVVKKHGGDPFVTDTTAIYKAERYTAMDYYRTAFAHGFLPSYLDCPVIIADGLKDEGVQVTEKVEIAKSIYDSDAMLVVSHATGHGASSFGGAIKNVAMGCVTKKTMCPDIGVLASTDIVAVDLATIGMIGKHLFEGDPTVQMREAHRLGLGELEYEIRRV